MCVLAVAALCLSLWGSASARAATVTVAEGADLQSVLNSARAGDVILLQSGATFTGNFVLPAHAGDPPIVLRSGASDADVPARGQRISPDDARFLAKLRSPNGSPALRTAPGAHHWRLELLEFLGNQSGTGDIIQLGSGSAEQNTLEVVPHDLAIDRCYIHADAGQGQKRGIALNSASTIITGSWISEIKMHGQDSQAIAGWNGPGPYTIVNNHLEAAGQALMIGGGDPSIQGLVPSEITIAGNYFGRPASWRNGSWQVKNLFELKNARGVRVESNVFENNWQAAQPGYAILFTPRNQNGQAPWATVEDVVFAYNIVRHVSGAINILGHDSPNKSATAKGIEISNNLVYDVDGGKWGGGGEFLRIGDGPADVTITRNTILQSGNLINVYGGSASQPTPVPGFVFTSNIARLAGYGVHGNDRAVGNDSIGAYFPGVVFNKNIFGGGIASQYPSGNQFLSSAELDRLFVNAAGEDFHLAPANSYARTSNGSGPAVGADVDRVMQDAAMVQAGSFVLTPDRHPERGRPVKGDPGGQ